MKSVAHLIKGHKLYPPKSQIIHLLRGKHYEFSFSNITKNNIFNCLLDRILILWHRKQTNKQTNKQTKLTKEGTTTIKCCGQTHAFSSMHTQEEPAWNQVEAASRFHSGRKTCKEKIKNTNILLLNLYSQSNNINTVDEPCRHIESFPAVGGMSEVRRDQVASIPQLEDHQLGWRGQGHQPPHCLQLGTNPTLARTTLFTLEY